MSALALKVLAEETARILAEADAVNATGWHTSTDLLRMLRWAVLSPRGYQELLRTGPISRYTAGKTAARTRITDRKLRLFACACVRDSRWPAIVRPTKSRPDPFGALNLADALEAAEEFADGFSDRIGPAGLLAHDAWRCLSGCDRVTAGLVAVACERWLAAHEGGARSMFASDPLGTLAGLAPQATDRACAYLRDVYDPAAPRLWQTCRVCGGEGKIHGMGYSDPVTLACHDCRGTGRTPPANILPALPMAEAIYRDRDWQALPALADCLQDCGLADVWGECSACEGGKKLFMHRGNLYKVGPAGLDGEWVDCFECQGEGRAATPDVILEHLTSGRPHARGCWALDAVTGRA